MDIVKTQYIFIDTQYCVGDPWNFTFNITDRHIECDKNERMRLSLVKFMTRYDWFSVRYPYNNFTITYQGTTYGFELTEGNYTYSQFCAELEKRLNEQKTNLGVSGTILVTYNKYQNGLSISFPDNVTNVRTMYIHPDKKRYWGFLGNQKASVNGVIKSDTSMDFYDGDDRLQIICTSGLQLHKHSSMRTTNEKTDNQRTILASFPISAYPYETILYEDNGDRYGHFIVGNKLVGSLSFKILSGTGLEAEYITDSHIVLRIDTYNDDIEGKNSADKSIKNVEEYLRLIFLSQNMGNAGDVPQ
jgi:hypothetical protein